MNKKKAVAIAVSIFAIIQTASIPVYAVSDTNQTDTTVTTITTSPDIISETTTVSDITDSTDIILTTEPVITENTTVFDEQPAPETWLAFASDETASPVQMYTEIIEKIVPIENTETTDTEKEIIASKILKTAPITVNITKSITFPNPAKLDEMLNADIPVNKTVAELIWTVNEYADGTTSISVRYDIYRNVLEENVLKDYPTADALTVYQLLEEQGFEKLSLPSARIIFDTGTYSGNITLTDSDNDFLRNEIMDKQSVKFSDDTVSVILTETTLFEQGYENNAEYITGFDFTASSETIDVMKYFIDSAVNDANKYDTYSQDIFTINLKPESEDNYDRHMLVIEDGINGKPYIVTLDAIKNKELIKELQTKYDDLMNKYTELIQEIEKYKSGEIKSDEYTKLENECTELKKQLDETKAELDKIKRGVNTTTSGNASSETGSSGTVRSSSSGGSFVSSGNASNRSTDSSSSGSASSVSDTNKTTGSASTSNGSDVKSTGSSDTAKTDTKTTGTPDTGDKGVKAPLIIGVGAIGVAGALIIKKKKDDSKKNKTDE